MYPKYDYSIVKLLIFFFLEVGKWLNSPGCAGDEPLHRDREI